MTPPKSRATLYIFLVVLAICLFATLHGLQRTGNPSRYFGEGRYTTGVSCGQLLLTAIFSSLIFDTRKKLARSADFVGKPWFWVLVSAGFVFLAFDDAFQFHERFDTIIQHTLNLPKTGWADRIDDAIIGFYGLIGLGVVWVCRSEWLSFRPMLKPLIIGFVFAFISVACDALSNGSDAFLWMGHDLARAKWLEGWFSVGDGAFTLLAESMFLAAFYQGYRSVKASAAPALPSSITHEADHRHPEQVQARSR